MSPGTLVKVQSSQYFAAAADDRRSTWTTLYRIAGASALTVVALIPIQILVFLLWPPPTTVLGYFSVFQSNLLLGLLDLDLLLVVDQLLTVAVLLGLYAALRRTNESLTLLATAAGVFGALLFVISREATFSMMWLSQQYAAANSDADRAALVAAGQTMLTIYNGTSFSIGYFLAGLAMLVISAVMLRGTVFSRGTAIAGLLTGVTALVPASFGTLGLALSFISLIPLVVWLLLIGRRLLQLGSGTRRSVQ